jgi:hypothetical protein
MGTRKRPLQPSHPPRIISRLLHPVRQPYTRVGKSVTQTRPEGQLSESKPESPPGETGCEYLKVRRAHRAMSLISLRTKCIDHLAGLASSMTNEPAIRVAGYGLFVGGVAVALAPLLWTAGFSEPVSVGFLIFSLFLGLLLSAWIAGIGAALAWDNNRHLRRGLAASGVGLLGAVLSAVVVL